MSTSTFNKSILAIALLMVIALVSLNGLVDPYGVLGTSSMPPGPSSNERFIKVEHLRESPDEYEILIFGSSRSGMTRPEWIEALTGEKTYNLSVFSGKPSDMAALYGAYRKTSKPPKTVMVGVDAMSFLLEPDEVDLSRRHHPEANGGGGIGYWLDYLLAPSVLPSIEKIKARSKPTIAFDWSEGTYGLLGYEREIEADHAAYKEKKFGSWTPRDFVSSLDKNQWSVFKTWLQTLKADGVEVRVFLQPMHRQWRARMAPLMPELFSMLNTLERWEDLSELDSDIDDHWYEQRHYREPIARQVVDRMFSDIPVKSEKLATTTAELRQFP